MIGYTIKQLRNMLDNKEIRSEELVNMYFDRIEKDNEQEDKINGFISIFKEDSIYLAKEADKELFSTQAPESKPLLGIPIAIKDNICIENTTNTCASHMLDEYISIYNAFVIDELKKAGAVIIGKTNMDEFAMGSSNETSYYGVVRNPHNRAYSSGGSSGGSASVVASDFSPVAVGSDTGGSIRLPASFCGVVGLKPTYGRVSRYGLVAFASSFDQIGPMTKTVEDNAILLRVIAGYDQRDSTSMKIDVPNYVKLMEDEIKGKKVGVIDEFLSDKNNPKVNKAVEDAVKVLESMGCEIVNISLPHTDYGLSAYYLLSNAEASSNLSRFDGVKYGFRSEQDTIREMYEQTRKIGFSTEVKRRIMLGTYALSSGYYEAYYNKAQKVRTLIKNDFEEAFKKADVLISPTSPTTAFKIGEKINDPLSMYMNDIYTVSASLSGVPALSIPCGKDSDGLPIGVQLMGNYFEEGKLFSFAKHIEESISDEV